MSTFLGLIFSSFQGHDPKLDQVLHSQLVTCTMWCFHRMACTDGDVVFIDQRLKNLSVCCVVCDSKCQSFEQLDCTYAILCMFLIVYCNTRVCANIQKAKRLKFIEAKRGFKVNFVLLINCLSVG